ncbi:MAG: hypothetical protein AMXMBFR7_00640 [Planctomycetota bacterium]
MPDAPPPATPPAETADGCAPGCCIFVMLAGIFLAVAAGIFFQRAQRGPDEPPGPVQLERDPVREARREEERERYRAANRAWVLGLGSFAYMLLVWSALEYWHARKPEPTAFGKRLSELGKDIPVDSAGMSSLGHPLRNARYALPIAAGVLAYDLALAGVFWSGSVTHFVAIPCALAAALFNIHALNCMHGYLAVRVLRAALHTPLHANAAGEVRVAWKIEARRDTRVAVKVILLGVDAYFPKAKWWQKSVTQRLECVHRAEFLSEPETPLPAGAGREGAVTLRLPDPLPAPKGKLHWFAALVAEIPGWPDFETVEPVQIPAPPEPPTPADVGLPDERPAPSPSE